MFSVQMTDMILQKPTEVSRGLEVSPANGSSMRSITQTALHHGPAHPGRQGSALHHGPAHPRRQGSALYHGPAHPGQQRSPETPLLI